MKDKNIDSIEKNLMKLDEYIKTLEKKREIIQEENLQKRMLISELKALNNEE